jgi:hypothetical protein
MLSTASKCPLRANSWFPCRHDSYKTQVTPFFHRSITHLTYCPRTLHAPITPRPSDRRCQGSPQPQTLPRGSASAAVGFRSPRKPKRWFTKGNDLLSWWLRKVSFSQRLSDKSALSSRSFRTPARLAGCCVPSPSAGLACVRDQTSGELDLSFLDQAWPAAATTRIATNIPIN